MGSTLANVAGYRSWARAKDRRTFASPDFKGDWLAGRDELSDAIERGDLPDWLPERVHAADIQDYGTEPIHDMTRATTLVTLLGYLSALALDVWLVFVLPGGSWQDHAGALLAIVGLFAFATGFLNATEVAKQLPPFFLADLTSPNLRWFIKGNFDLLAMSSDFARAFVFGRDPWTEAPVRWKVALFPLTVIIVILETLIALSWFAASFAYLVFVLPFAYLAYAVVSLPLIRISETDEDRWQAINPWGLKPRNVVASHMFELRVFTVGALSTFAAAVVRIVPLY